MLTASVWGGAGEHGRSCYYIENEELSVLLDCGGKKENGGEYPFLDSTIIAGLSAVFLSHAHEDHCVAIPLLYQLGYKGPIWTTRATVDQLPAYYQAWRQYVERKSEIVPYTTAEVESIPYRYLEDAAPAGTWFQIERNIRVCWGPSGHMLGSVWLKLELAGKSVYYSGDYSPEPCLLKVQPPASIVSHAYSPDLAIIDAAYGLDTDTQQNLLSKLIVKIRQVSEREGHVLLPLPLFGRGQDILLLLTEQLPELPLAVEIEILDGFLRFESWPDWLQDGAQARMKRTLHGHITTVFNEADRRRMLAKKPHVILTSDGMLQTPIARWYYEQLCSDARHCVILTGHMSEKIEEGGGAASGCEVEFLRYKIHQGLHDVCAMLDSIRPKSTILAHGKKRNTDLLLEQLLNSGYRGLHSLIPGQSITI